MTLPKEHKALYLDSKCGNFVIASNNVPRPGTGELLLKVKACGLNPVDWKIQKYGIFVEEYPVVLGINIAGDIVEVGEGVEGFLKGDRVLTHGLFGNTAGGFQEFVLGLSTHTSKLPRNISYDQGATFSSSIGCAYLGLYNHRPHGLGFETPLIGSALGKYVGTPLLIFGGATAVGQYTIQLAKLSGFSPIITTASLKHEQLLNGYGADKIIDRNASYATLREEVIATTSQPIEYILDAVSIAETQQLAHDILARGGHLQVVQTPEIPFSPEKNVGFTKGVRSYPENQEAFSMLYSHLTGLLERGLIKPCAVEVVPGGLAGIPVGLERLAKDEISGVKLVVHPDETA